MKKRKRLTIRLILQQYPHHEKSISLYRAFICLVMQGENFRTCHFISSSLTSKEKEEENEKDQFTFRKPVVDNYADGSAGIGHHCLRRPRGN
jgi:hypothetical protein